MYTIITDNLHAKSTTITEAEAINIINTTDILISTDYHILKEINRRYDSGTFKKYEKHTKDMIDMHNTYVKPTDWLLFLGDLSEGEIRAPDDIKKLYDYTRTLNGKKILVRGNNDNLDSAFYNKCGFQYVADEELIVSGKRLIFSHDAYDLEHSVFNTDWINVHGHFHGSCTYYGVDWKRHIDVYHELYHNTIHRLSYYLAYLREGNYNPKSVYYPPQYFSF
jgi:calcineurin-like phosphoesterase family protein